MKPTPSRDLPLFRRQSQSSGERITRIGQGAVGGKASGLLRVHRGILPRFSAEEFPQVEVNIPTLTVVTTEVFDAFMARNGFDLEALSREPDDRIAHAFQRAEMPAEFIGDLRDLAAQSRAPLAVRSSSLLEDDLEHPFAGVYATKMIPNNQPALDLRFRRLIEAIKFVYASTFFRAARSYLAEVGREGADEKMAVIIQEVVGQRLGDRYYPTLSGVARSYNYYPTGHAQPEDGVVNLALGLGKTIVDGGLCWTYSPAYPKSPPPFAGTRELLQNTQTRFWTVHIGAPPLPDPIRETEYLRHQELSASVEDDTLRHLVSSYDPSSDRVYPGQAAQGPFVLDFAPLLSLRVIPLNDLVVRLLGHAREELETPVEIEFALNLDRKKGVPARFGFLQVRPMMVSDEEVEVSSEDLTGPKVLLASTRAMGNGERGNLCDVVYLKPKAFDAKATRQIAKEVAELNQGLVDDRRAYLLIGFGRWGSSDPWLGVPVEWGQITGARVIVEATLPEMNPDLSQGSHFFHNMISFKVLYFSVPHQRGGPIDWSWLERQQIVAETPFVKHVRTASPLTVRADGRRRRGVVYHDE